MTSWKFASALSNKVNIIIDIKNTSTDIINEYDFISLNAFDLKNRIGIDKINGAKISSERMYLVKFSIVYYLIVIFS